MKEKRLIIFYTHLLLSFLFLPQTAAAQELSCNDLDEAIIMLSAVSEELDNTRVVTEDFAELLAVISVAVDEAAYAEKSRYIRQLSYQMEDAFEDEDKERFSAAAFDLADEFEFIYNRDCTYRRR